jgi:hypothetical protein
MQDAERKLFKNIFKKVPKIPPGELQARTRVVKWEPTIKNEKLKIKNSDDDIWLIMEK